MMIHSSQDPLPVGLFGIIAGQARFSELKTEIEHLRDRLNEQHAAVGGYLSEGTTVIALMEQTTDILDSAFELPGGSAILTDGKYYWRRDTALYVEHYRVALPDDFVQHAESLEWVCPEVSPQRVLEVDSFLHSP
jgi:hypothetical protein